MILLKKHIQGGRMKQVKTRLLGLIVAGGMIAVPLAGKAERPVPQVPITQELVAVEGGTVTREDNMLMVAGFQIGKYEVSQASFTQIMGRNPSQFQDPANPVENVSWYDAVEYCNRLSLYEKLIPAYSFKGAKPDPDTWPRGWNTDSASHLKITVNTLANGYRLPNSNEWEFAYLGGNQHSGYRFSGGNELDELGWYSANADSIPHNIGLKMANELGIFDLCGNLREWVGDKPKSSETDALNLNKDSVRIARGAGFNCPKTSCGAEIKLYLDPLHKAPDLGFRVGKFLKK